MPSDAAAFLVGVFSAVVQVVLVRELFGALEGHEVSVAASVAAWVGAVAAGAGLGGWIAGRRRPDAGHLLLLVALLLAAAWGGVALLRDARGWLDVPRGHAIGLGDSLRLVLAGVAPAAAVVGCLLPVFAAASAPADGLRSAPARFYAVDAAGTALGGGCAPLLLRALPVPSLTALCAALCAVPLIVAAVLGRSRPRGSGGRLAGVAALAGLAAALAFAAAVENATQDRRRRSLGIPADALGPFDTPYERLDVVPAAAPGDAARVFGNGRIVALAPDPYGHGVQADLVLLEHPRPRDVLVVGPGPIDAARAARRHGAERIVVGTFDPFVLDALAAVLPPADRAALDRVETLGIDARAWLRAAPTGALDLIALFPPDPTTALANRFYTAEIFAEAARVLRSDGLLSLRIPWAANAADRWTVAFARSVAAAMRESFGTLRVVPGTEAILLASRAAGTPTVSAAELARRAAARPGLDAAAYPEAYFAGLLPPEEVARVTAAAAPSTGPESLPNRDLRPVAYRARLLAHLEKGATGLGRRGGSRAARWLDRLGAIPAWAYPAAAMLVPLLLVAAGRRRGRIAGLETLGLGVLAGGAAMALQMLLLLLYQVQTGRLYGGFAWLTGVFMAGLAAGGWAGSRCPERLGWSPRGALLRIEGAAAGLVVLGWISCPAWADRPSAVVVGVVLAGFAAGAPFASLVRIAGTGSAGAPRAGAWASAGDHLGAVLGALGATLVLLPAHGFRTALATIAGLHAAAAAGAAIRRRALGE